MYITQISVMYVTVRVCVIACVCIEYYDKK